MTIIWSHTATTRRTLSTMRCLIAHHSRILPTSLCPLSSPSSRLAIHYAPVRHYSKRRGRKTSYRVKEEMHRHWLEHVQLTDEKYDVWTREFEELTSDRLVDQDIADAIEGMHNKLNLHTLTASEHEAQEDGTGQEFTVPVRLPEEYEQMLLQWIDDCGHLTITMPAEAADGKGERQVNLFVTHEKQRQHEEEEEEKEGGRVHHGLIRALLHSSYIVQHGDYVDNADMQRMLVQYSMEELSKIGSEVIDSMATHFLSYAMYPSSGSNFLQIASPRYDLQPYEYTSFDIIDHHNVTMENVKRTKKSIIDPQTIVMLSRQLGLYDLLLHEIAIMEAKEGEEALALEDELDRQLMDPSTSKKRKRKLENIRKATTVSNVAVFETDAETAMASYRDVVDRQLMEALIGAIEVHYGTEYTAAFFVQKVLPLLQDRFAMIDTTDYVLLLKQLLDQHNASPEYRVDKNVFKRRHHRDIKVSVIVNGEELGNAFGETYSEAKYKAAKAVYTELEENPLRLEKIKHKLVNTAYISSLSRLLGT